MRLLRVQTGGSSVSVQLPQVVQDTSTQSKLQLLDTQARSQGRLANTEQLAASNTLQTAQLRTGFLQERTQQASQREAELERRAREAEAARQAQLEALQDDDYANATLAVESIKLDFQERGGSRQQYIERALRALGSYNLDAAAKRALIGDMFALAGQSADRESQKREAELEEIKDAQRQYDTQTALWQAQNLGQELRYATGARREELLGQVNSFVNSYMTNSELDPLTALEVSSAAIGYLRPYAEDGSELAVTIDRFNIAQTRLAELYLDRTISPSERLMREAQIRTETGYASNPVMPAENYDLRTIFEAEKLEQDYTRFQGNLQLEQELSRGGMIGQVANQYRNNPTQLEQRCRQSGSAIICEAAEVASMMGSLEQQAGETRLSLSRIDGQIAALQASTASAVISMIRSNTPGESEMADSIMSQIADPNIVAIMGLMREGRQLTAAQQAAINAAQDDILSARNAQVAALRSQKEALTYEYQRQEAAIAPYFGADATAAANAARNVTSGAQPPARGSARPGR